MKYSTKLVYGIPPAVIANMRHVDALNACKRGGKLQLERFSKPPLAKWCGRRMALVAYISKSLEWVTCSENIRHSFVELNKNQKGSKNNFFKAWGIIYKNGKEEIFKDKSVDEWCLENNIASSTIYTSMREERVLKRGRFKGYRFFRFGEYD